MQSSSPIPFEQIEEAANSVLDHHAFVGRALTRSERADFAPILELYESWQESPGFKELAADAREHHADKLAAVRDVIEPPPPEDLVLEPLSLSEIESRIVAFVDLAETFQRPLMPEERKPFKDLLANCYAEHTRSAIAALPEAQQTYYYELITSLRNIVEPDPPVGEGELLPSFTRTRSEQRNELNYKIDKDGKKKGNYSVKTRALEGLSIRRLTPEETRSRLKFVGKLITGIGVLTRELALASPPHRAIVADIVRCARFAIKRAEKFTQSYDPDSLPEELTPEEISDHARIMGELTQESVAVSVEDE